MVAGFAVLALSGLFGVALLLCLGAWGKDGMANGHEIGWVKGKRSRW